MKTDTASTSRNLSRPPLYTLLVELTGWTLDRTASIPKSQRFTFGQRLDNLALDALQAVTKAIFTGDPQRKQAALSDLLLLLEQSQALWRLVHDRRWISLQQLAHVSGRLDEAGRMANGWRQQQAKRGANVARRVPPSSQASPDTRSSPNP